MKEAGIWIGRIGSSQKNGTLENPITISPHPSLGEAPVTFFGPFGHLDSFLTTGQYHGGGSGLEAPVYFVMVFSTPYWRLKGNFVITGNNTNPVATGSVSGILIYNVGKTTIDGVTIDQISDDDAGRLRHGIIVLENTLVDANVRDFDDVFIQNVEIKQVVRHSMRVMNYGGGGDDIDYLMNGKDFKVKVMNSLFYKGINTQNVYALGLWVENTELFRESETSEHPLLVKWTYRNVTCLGVYDYILTVRGDCEMSNSNLGTFTDLHVFNNGSLVFENNIVNIGIINSQGTQCELGELIIRQNEFHGHLRIDLITKNTIVEKNWWRLDYEGSAVTYGALWIWSRDRGSNTYQFQKNIYIQNNIIEMSNATFDSLIYVRNAMVPINDSISLDKDQLSIYVTNNLIRQGEETEFGSFAKFDFTNNDQQYSVKDFWVVNNLISGDYTYWTEMDPISLGSCRDLCVIEYNILDPNVEMDLVKDNSSLTEFSNDCNHENDYSSSWNVGSGNCETDIDTCFYATAEEFSVPKYFFSPESDYSDLTRSRSDLTSAGPFELSSQNENIIDCSEDSDTNDGLSTGEIVSIVVGATVTALVLLCALVVIVFILIVVGIGIGYFALQNTKNTVTPRQQERDEELKDSLKEKKESFTSSSSSNSENKCNVKQKKIINRKKLQIFFTEC